jgi:hypothetical protein
MIVVTQAWVLPGQEYVSKQIALRQLRRRLSDVVFTALRHDQLPNA